MKGVARFGGARATAMSPKESPIRPRSVPMPTIASAPTRRPCTLKPDEAFVSDRAATTGSPAARLTCAAGTGLSLSIGSWARASLCLQTESECPGAGRGGSRGVMHSRSARDLLRLWLAPNGIAADAANRGARAPARGRSLSPTTRSSSQSKTALSAPAKLQARTADDCARAQR